MKKLFFVIGLLSITSSIFSMDILRQSAQKCARASMARLVGMGATVTPAAVFADKNGDLPKKSYAYFDAQQIIDSAYVILPTALIALGSRSALKTITPRFAKTSTAAVIKGVCNGALLDWFFFENSTLKKAQAKLKPYGIQF